MSTAAFWRSFDALFEEMDRFFEKMDDLFDEAKSIHSKVHVDSPDEHRVRFRAHGWRERLKLTWQFFGMTLAMLFKGCAAITFRRRNSVK